MDVCWYGIWGIYGNIPEIAEQRTKLSFDDLELAGAMTVGE